MMLVGNYPLTVDFAQANSQSEIQIDRIFVGFDENATHQRRGKCDIGTCSDGHLSYLERWRVGRYFWNQLGLEYTVMWTLAALYFLVHGGGSISLDHLLAREF